MIEYKDPAAMRELMAKVTPGPWEINGARITFNAPQGQHHTADNMQFIAISREALPYWIERAEKAEQKIKKMAERVMDVQCPPNANSACGVHHPDCLSCWLKWAMKEDE